MNNQAKPTVTKSIAMQKYASARGNLLLMIAFTVINILLLLFNSDTMFLFSATVPYFSAAFGKYSEIPALFTVGLVIAFITLTLYLLCWIFSKKHYGWIITALVLFIIDSVCMVGLYILSEDFSGVIDLAIHIWVLYYLIIGVKYGKLLKTLPEDEEEDIPFAEDNAEFDNNENQTAENSIPLRSSATDKKIRILLESEFNGHKIVYRRVKRINELVIDGYVYDDIEMLVETAHALNARIDGHAVQAGFDGAAHSYLRIDGEQTTRKLRLY